MNSSNLIIRTFGIEDYSEVWAQMKAFTMRRSSETADELWLLQHHPVFTLGQAGKREHILNPRDIPIVHSDRGGQVTYHGPGQLVIYPLLDIRRRKMGVRAIVDLIEKSIIEVLDSFEIIASTRKGAPGVYVDGEKIAALGLRVKQGCSYHGLSLNIDMDLSPFSDINPCGYPDLRTTQVSRFVKKCKDDHMQTGLFDEVSERMTKVLEKNLLQ